MLQIKIASTRADTTGSRDSRVDCLTKTNEWSDKADDDCLDLSEDDDK